MRTPEKRGSRGTGAATVARPIDYNSNSSNVITTPPLATASHSMRRTTRSLTRRQRNNAAVGETEETVAEPKTFTAYEEIMITGDVVDGINANHYVRQLDSASLSQPHANNTTLDTANDSMHSMPYRKRKFRLFSSSQEDQQHPSLNSTAAGRSDEVKNNETICTKEKVPENSGGSDVIDGAPNKIPVLSNFYNNFDIAGKLHVNSAQQQQPPKSFADRLDSTLPPKKKLLAYFNTHCYQPSSIDTKESLGNQPKNSEFNALTAVLPDQRPVTAPDGIDFHATKIESVIQPSVLDCVTDTTLPPPESDFTTTQMANANILASTFMNPPNFNSQQQSFSAECQNAAVSASATFIRPATLVNFGGRLYSLAAATSPACIVQNSAASSVVLPAARRNNTALGYFALSSSSSSSFAHHAPHSTVAVQPQNIEPIEDSTTASLTDILGNHITRMIRCDSSSSSSNDQKPAKATDSGRQITKPEPPAAPSSSSPAKMVLSPGLQSDDIAKALISSKFMFSPAPVTNCMRPPLCTTTTTAGNMVAVVKQCMPGLVPNGLSRTVHHFAPQISTLKSSSASFGGCYLENHSENRLIPSTQCSVLHSSSSSKQQLSVSCSSNGGISPSKPQCCMQWQGKRYRLNIAGDEASGSLVRVHHDPRGGPLRFIVQRGQDGVSFTGEKRVVKAAGTAFPQLLTARHAQQTARAIVRSNSTSSSSTHTNYGGNGSGGGENTNGAPTFGNDSTTLPVNVPSGGTNSSAAADGGSSQPKKRRISFVNKQQQCCSPARAESASTIHSGSGGGSVIADGSCSNSHHARRRTTDSMTSGGGGDGSSPSATSNNGEVARNSCCAPTPKDVTAANGLKKRSTTPADEDDDEIVVLSDGKTVCDDKAKRARFVDSISTSTYTVHHQPVSAGNCPISSSAAAAVQNCVVNVKCAMHVAASNSMPLNSVIRSSGVRSVKSMPIGSYTSNDTISGRTTNSEPPISLRCSTFDAFCTTNKPLVFAQPIGNASESSLRYAMTNRNGLVDALFGGGAKSTATKALTVDESYHNGRQRRRGLWYQTSSTQRATAVRLVNHGRYAPKQRHVLTTKPDSELPTAVAAFARSKSDSSDAVVERACKRSSPAPQLASSRRNSTVLPASVATATSFPATQQLVLPPSSGSLLGQSTLSSSQSNFIDQLLQLSSASNTTAPATGNTCTVRNAGRKSVAPTPPPPPPQLSTSFDNASQASPLSTLQFLLPLFSSGCNNSNSGSAATQFVTTPTDFAAYPFQQQRHRAVLQMLSAAQSVAVMPRIVSQLPNGTNFCIAERMTVNVVGNVQTSSSFASDRLFAGIAQEVMKAKAAVKTSSALSAVAATSTIGSSSTTTIVAATTAAAADDERYVCALCSRVFSLSQRAQYKTHMQLHALEETASSSRRTSSSATMSASHHHHSSFAVSLQAQTCSRAPGDATSSREAAPLARSISNGSSSNGISAAAAAGGSAEAHLVPGSPNSNAAANPRPYQCIDCNTGFRIPGHLQKHLRCKMHILKLECLSKLPSGLYEELERRGMTAKLQACVDTADCDTAYESLRKLAHVMECERRAAAAAGLAEESASTTAAVLAALGLSLT